MADENTTDEFEIEVHDLRDPDAAPIPDAETVGAAMQPMQPMQPTPASLRLARSPLVARLTRRAKLARALGTVGVVVVACLILLASSPALRGALTGASAAKNVGETLPPGAEEIFLDDPVPWGALSLDGKRIENAASGPVSLVLLRGEHTLAYDAPPFAPLRCHLRVPYSATDTCPLELAPPQATGAAPAFVRIIDLGATPDRLPTAQLTALVSAADASLSVLTTSAPLSIGEYYLAANGSVARATAPLVGTLRFGVNRNPQLVAPYLPGGRLCSQICYLSQDGNTTGTWQLLAFAQVSWSYATPAGALVVPSAPANPLRDASITLITLNVTWDGAWHATALANSNQFGTNPVCAVGGDDMPAIPTSYASGVQFAQREIPQPRLADGCLVVTRFYGDSEQLVPEGEAYAFYRFGVLLAANARAHTLWPDMPQATPTDLALLGSAATPKQ